MAIKTGPLAVLLLVFTGVCNSAEFLDPQLAAFLSNPSDRTYLELKAELNAARPDGISAIDSSLIGKLNSRIESGDEAAMDIGFYILDWTDGGDLEDVFRSLGLGAERNPQSFLALVLRHRLSTPVLESSLTMLPLSTVDDVNAMLDEVRKRIALFDALSAPDSAAAGARERIIRILRSAEQYYLKHVPERPPEPAPPGNSVQTGE